MRELLNTIIKREWRLVFWVSLVLILITTSTYVYAFLNAPAGSRYLGLHAQTNADPLIYYSYIRQSAEGVIFLKDLFTPETQQLGTVNVVWFIGGQLARLLQLSPIAIFQLLRIVTIPILVLVTYLCISYVVASKKSRAVALLLACFGGGWGVYFIPIAMWRWLSLTAVERLAYWPSDIMNTESTIFTSAYQSPHFIISWTCLLLLLLLAAMAFERRSFKYATAAGLVGLVFFNFHPYYAPAVALLLTTFLGVRFLINRRVDWRAAGSLILIGVISSPSVGYHFYLLKNEPVLAARALQNVTPLPFLWPVVFGLGAFIVLAILGVWHLCATRQLNDRFLFFINWAVVGGLLVGLPLQFQSRYLEGLQLPLAILSAIALVAGYDWLVQRRPALAKNVLHPPIIGFLFLFVFGLSPLFNLARDGYYFYQQRPIFYLSADEQAALDWLENEPSNQIVLASSNNSLFLPPFAGQIPYYNQTHENIYNTEKKQAVIWFFSDNDQDAKKAEWLALNNIAYVFYSAEEKQFGTLDVFNKPYLKKVFESNEITIFETIAKK